MQPNANNNVINSAPQTTPMNPGGDVVFRDKPKKNKGMIIGMVILALLATGGIGFGVWAFLSGNQKEAKLNDKISDLQSQIAEMPEVDETVIDVETNSDVNTTDYIYVGEWGLKIKIPEELGYVGYEYINGGYSDLCMTLGVSGAAKREGSEKPQFAKIGDGQNVGDYLGYIMRCPKEVEYNYGELTTIGDGTYNYYYNHIQYVMSTDETTKDWEVESASLIENMLKNPDNYSAI